MTRLACLGTYLPPWTDNGRRTVGPDEDVITQAVEAGLAAIGGPGSRRAVSRVTLVSRELPLLEGGSGAALLAALDLPPGTPVAEVVGGAPQALAAIACAQVGNLVIGADLPAGAGAILVGPADGPGLDVRRTGGYEGSLPVRTRNPDGTATDFGDPRLERAMGIAHALRALDPDTRNAPPVAVAGATSRDLKGLISVPLPTLPTTGASAAFFAIAAALDDATFGTVLAIEQASAVAVALDSLAGSGPALTRNEPDARPLPATSRVAGGGIPISLAAYSRAFDSKLRWQAARYSGSDELIFPPRFALADDGSVRTDYELVPLPRTGTVYTQTTVRIPVPDLPVPYSLVIVCLDDTDDVRALVKTTGVPAGATNVGDHGRLVLRRVAVRSGVPDYGYAFTPDHPASDLANHNGRNSG